MSRTASDIITSAYKNSGVLGEGSTPSDNEVSDTLQELNNLIETLEGDGLWPYHKVVTTATLPASQSTYTVGVGGDIDISRPTDVSSVNIIVGSTTNSVKLVDPLTFANLSRTADITGIPSFCVYRQTFPYGELELYPAPLAGYSVEILSDYTSDEYGLDTVIYLPKGYGPALQWLLAEVICDGSDLPNDRVSMRAASMRNTIEALNADPSLLGPDTSSSGLSASDPHGTAIRGGWW